MIYGEVKDQHIWDGASQAPVELNLMPVFKLFDLYEVPKEDRLKVLRKIRFCYAVYLPLRYPKSFKGAPVIGEDKEDEFFPNEFEENEFEENEEEV